MGLARWGAVCCAVCCAAWCSPARAARGGQLQINVVDRDTGQPIACRMHLRNAKKKPQKGGKAPFWHDHFVFSGEITLKLPNGFYQFEMERGPEYLIRSGHFTISDFADDSKTIDMKRVVDMAKEGWWSGDLHVERPLKEIELLMQADDLHLAEVVTWSSGKTDWMKSALPDNPLVRFGDSAYQQLAGMDDRAGGRLLLLNLTRPLDLSGDRPEFPPALSHVAEAARQEQAWIDAANPTSWDLPVWVAAGKLNSIELADSRLCRESVIESDAGGRPRDKLPYPGPSGVGRWSEAVYHHLLNCGLRIPPSAGSGSGSASNPVGYNRAYVFLGEQPFSYDAWWAALRAGQVVVTNGPLIRPTVEGHPPGHVFKAEAGQKVELEIGLTLSTREKIEYLQVVKGGHVAAEMRLDEWAKAGGRLPKLEFDRSGWFLVRAVTNAPGTFRFASTGPYYVDIGYQPTISKASAQFFVDWVNERGRRLKLEDAAERREVMRHHRTARDFWQAVLEKANAD